MMLEVCKGRRLREEKSLRAQDPPATCVRGHKAKQEVRAVKRQYIRQLVGCLSLCMQVPRPPRGSPCSASSGAPAAEIRSAGPVGLIAAAHWLSSPARTQLRKPPGTTQDCLEVSCLNYIARPAPRGLPARVLDAEGNMFSSLFGLEPAEAEEEELEQQVWPAT